MKIMEANPKTLGKTQRVRCGLEAASKPDAFHGLLRCHEPMEKTQRFCTKLLPVARLLTSVEGFDVNAVHHLLLCNAEAPE